MIKDTQKLKIMSILGTRPEIIRLSRILPLMDQYFDHSVVFTEQSYDYELSKVFFEELDLRKPNHLLDVKSETLGGQIAKIIEQTEKVMLLAPPDAVFILGDTNSALSGIVARRLKIPIFHMEAGNRSYDWNVPEEINRRIIDHISNYNLAYTEHSRRYLIEEGIHPSTIFVTGSPFAEIFSFFQGKINSSPILEELNLKSQEYFLVSVHREENVDNQENLKTLFESLDFLAEKYELPIIVSLHPRTKSRLEKAKIKPHRLINLHKPFGYFAYNKLQQNALCVLSDSGSIQEESAILGFPAVQVRVSTERPEAFDSGSIILSGFNFNAITNAVILSVDSFKKGESIVIPNDYKDTNVSTKVVKLIMGLASIKKYHNANKPR